MYIDALHFLALDLYSIEEDEPRNIHNSLHAHDSCTYDGHFILCRQTDLMPLAPSATLPIFTPDDMLQLEDLQVRVGAKAAVCGRLMKIGSDSGGVFSSPR